MIDNEKFLEDTINQLESSIDEMGKMKFSLLDNTLEQIGYIFELNNEGIEVFKVIGKEEIKGLISTIDIEMIPLFEEFKYEKGLNKLQHWKKLLQENLE